VKQSAYHIIEHKQLPARALGALQQFINLIEHLHKSIDGLALHEQIEHVIHDSGLIEHYKKEKGERGRSRLENLDELINAGRNFDEDELEPEQAELDPLTAFLSHASLEAGERQGGEWEDCVQLMTLHSAKGLEFKQVFLVGMEEGLFPHKLSMEESGRLEEERRLCYVGMTRAMQKLTISYAEKRRLYGEEKFARPSRFVAEIPREYMEEVRLGGSVSTPMYDPFANRVEDSSAPVQLGQRVFHNKFGEGVVMNYEGNGRHARVQINFESAGSKWLVMEYANLQLC
jgi:DNA helicase-2/ATP-dependent DNA helicase PcrA